MTFSATWNLYLQNNFNLVFCDINSVGFNKKERTFDPVVTIFTRVNNVLPLWQFPIIKFYLSNSKYCVWTAKRYERGKTWWRRRAVGGCWRHDLTSSVCVVSCALLCLSVVLQVFQSLWYSSLWMYCSEKKYADKKYVVLINVENKYQLTNKKRKHMAIKWLKINIYLTDDRGIIVCLVTVSKYLISIPATGQIIEPTTITLIFKRDNKVASRYFYSSAHPIRAGCLTCIESILVATIHTFAEIRVNLWPVDRTNNI